jgi:serine/threonine protein kinase
VEGEDLEGYEVGALIGRGASTCVHRARRLGRAVPELAVKRSTAPSPLPAGRPGPLDREARLLGACDHPNLLRLVDVVPDGEDIALVTILVGGGSLAAWATKAPVPPPVVVDLALDLAAAVVSLQRLGIVHGDLKPANVLLTRDGRPVLADLGAAVRQGSPLLGPGSGAFAAPELVGGAVAALHHDVYGLGAIAVALLTGQPPRAGGGGPADVGLSRPLAAVLATATATSPGERYPSALALWAALCCTPEATRLAGGRLGPFG